MAVLKEYEDTNSEYGEYGGQVVTHTKVKVFADMDELQDHVNASRPLYLKHAHPRDGKILEHSTDVSHTFTFGHTNAEMDVVSYIRVYRLETPEEQAQRLYDLTEAAIGG